MPKKFQYTPGKDLATSHVGGDALNAMAFEIVAPNCNVCKSPYRAQIDKCLAMGWTQRSVIDHFNQVLGETYFAKDSMSRHRRLHLSISDAAIRKVIEARAKQFQVDVDDVSGNIMTKAAALDTVIVRGLDALSKGVTFAEPRDVLNAIQILEKMEAEWKETAIDEMLKEFKAFTDAVRDVVGEDMYAAIWAGFEARLGDQRPALEIGAAPEPEPASDSNEILGEVTDVEDEED